MSLSVVGNNKYRIIRALGNGSFSVVYLATDDEEG